jgi:toxin YoeB
MRIAWTVTAWEDYLYWQTIDKQKLKRINELVKAIIRDPFKGIGNPEPLKHDLQGFWSRRIDGEHRLVYSFFYNILYFLKRIEGIDLV